MEDGKGVVSLLKMRSYFTDTQATLGKMEEKAARKGGGSARILNILASSLPDEAIELLCHSATKGAPKGIGESAIISALGGKITADRGIDSTAFSQRDAAFWIVVSCTCAKFGREPTEAQKKTVDDFLNELTTKPAACSLARRRRHASSRRTSPACLRASVLRSAAQSSRRRR